MSIETRQVFRSALARARKALKQQGFASKASTLWRQASASGYRVEEANVELIDIQGSRSGGTYTINYGAISCCVWRTQKREEPAAKHMPSEWHWSERIAGPDGRELWLPIGLDLDELEVDLLTCLTRDVLPALHGRTSDEALASAWLSGWSGGLTAPQRLLYCAIVLKKLHRHDDLRNVVRELKEVIDGKACEPRFMSDIRRLELDDRAEEG